MRQFFATSERLTILAIAGVITLLGVRAASATAIISRPTGISSPDTFIDFSEIVLINQTVMGNQYSGLGVVNFTGLFYDGCPTCFPPSPDSARPYLTNFLSNQGGFHPDFSITFDSVVTDAAFAFSSLKGLHTFSAFNDAELIETFTLFTDATTCNNTSGWCYYGFEGTAGFDRIVVEMNQISAIIDNLQFDSQVPEPSAILLFGAGLLGLAAHRHRRFAWSEAPLAMRRP